MTSDAPVLKPKTSRWARWLFVVLLALVLTVLMLEAWGPGVSVEVANTGQSSLGEVVVSVTGKEYAIGSLAPGQRVRTAVSPTGESSVKIVWRDADGRAASHLVDCYFDAAGWVGKVLVEIDGVEVTRSEHRVRVWP